MTGSRIADVRAWEALDSRGDPTVAVTVELAGGSTGTASAPSGASTGRAEARPLRDGDGRFEGMGVRRAVANVTGVLRDAVIGVDAAALATVDRALRQADGSADLSVLGANAVLPVSVAASEAAAQCMGQALFSFLGDGPPLLPLPMVNIVSGGAHAGSAVDIQDVLVVPVGARSFTQAIEWVWRVRAATRRVLENRGHNVALVADEGGFGPALSSNVEALQVVVRGIEAAGLTPGEHVGLAVDVAASQFVTDGGYYRLTRDGRCLSGDEWVDELASWVTQFPLVSLEDPLCEDDWAGWVRATEQLGDRVQLVGDDLFATTVARVQQGIEAGAGNAVLVKPNQVGTLTDAKEAVRLARRAGYATILSARSGETEDHWLADLAVAWRTGQLKIGSLARSERTAKWNRLLQLENTLSTDVEYAGRTVLAR